MIIDSHIHLNEIGGSYQKACEKLCSDMTQNGIDKSIIIADNVTGSGCADLETALNYANDNIFVIGSPNILKPTEYQFEKFQKLLEYKKIIGLKLFPGHDPYYPTDKRCDMYYKLAQKYNIPVVFHTGINVGDINCAKYNDPKLIAEVAKKYPNLKIVVAHYFWPELDYCYETTRGYKNIYFDTSALADLEVVKASGGLEKIREILQKTIADNTESVIFGTDYPECNVKKHLELVNSLEVSKLERNKIFAENAISLFGLNN